MKKTIELPYPPILAHVTCVHPLKDGVYGGGCILKIETTSGPSLDHDQGRVRIRRRASAPAIDRRLEQRGPKFVSNLGHVAHRQKPPLCQFKATSTWQKCA